MRKRRLVRWAWWLGEDDAVTEPVVPEAGLVPVGYADLLELVKAEVQAARVRAARVVNTELVVLYWRIGRLILDRQGAQGWGAGVTGRFAADLRAEFPTMRGLSPRNLAYMRAFAAASRAGRLCNRLLHNFRGVTSRCCWTSSTTPLSGSSTPAGPPPMGGRGRC